MTMSNEDTYRSFIQTATARDLMHQLNLDLKEPLTSAEATVNMLMMLQNPSPAICAKLENGEIDPGQMLQQLSENLIRALDVIDFYRQTLDEG